MILCKHRGNIWLLSIVWTWDPHYNQPISNIHFVITYEPPRRHLTGLMMAHRKDNMWLEFILFHPLWFCMVHTTIHNSFNWLCDLQIQISIKLICYVFYLLTYSYDLKRCLAFISTQTINSRHHPHKIKLPSFRIIGYYLSL